MLRTTPHWGERRARVMGSPAHVIVGGGEAHLLDWAVAELERLEQCWSRFRGDSELSRLVARPGRWVPVSADLALALRCARVLWERTAGAFDPTVRTSLEALGYDRTFRDVEPVGPAPARPVAAPGFDRVELDLAAPAARVAAGVGLDLGGVGKGLAADLVAEGLLQRGARSALVGLGGDIRITGEPPEGGWRIPVQDPFDADAVWTEVVLHEGAVVTSTSLMRRWRRGDQDLHHIVDPLTGSPTRTDVVAVVARGPEAWMAEGLAKAVMVMGEPGAAAVVERTGVRVTLFRVDRTAVTIDDAGVLCSPS